MTDKNPNEELMLDIFDLGGVQVSDPAKGGGFRTKHHETAPQARLSPLYFNLRTQENPGKRGPLTPELVDRIGRMLYDLAKKFKLDCRFVAGVPNAGDPFADAFAKAAWKKDGIHVTVLRMEKAMKKSERRVTRLITPVASGKEVLLIDDLVTLAKSKLEAIKVLTSAGLRVSNLLVLIDREQGGIDALERDANVSCYAVFRVTDLLDLYLVEERITAKEYEGILEYLSREKRPKDQALS